MPATRGAYVPKFAFKLIQNGAEPVDASLIKGLVWYFKWDCALWKLGKKTDIAHVCVINKNFKNLQWAYLTLP